MFGIKDLGTWVNIHFANYPSCFKLMGPYQPPRFAQHAKWEKDPNFHSLVHFLLLLLLCNLFTRTFRVRLLLIQYVVLNSILPLLMILAVVTGYIHYSLHLKHFMYLLNSKHLLKIILTKKSNHFRLMMVENTLVIFLKIFL